MDEGELEQIRAKRMAEMRSTQPGGPGGPAEIGPGSGATGDGQKQRQAQQEAQAREQEMTHLILSQVLDQQARARLSNISVAKPEKARQLESMIVQMARFGQINGKLGDEQFKELLDKVNQQTQQSQTTVKFDRRRAAIDSDSD